MKKVIIIGGGAASLIVAEKLSKSFDVTVYEKEKTIGQKFLVAGKGGFNLTNIASDNDLLSKYKPTGFMDNSLNKFSTSDFREWLLKLGIPTYEGTSRRVFPEKGIRPIEVLNKIKETLIKQNVKIVCNHQLFDFNNDFLTLKNETEKLKVKADYYIFSLGGASWGKTGSDGKWFDLFIQKGIKVNQFEASNCGINIDWQDNIKKFYAGKPLKNIKVKVSETDIKGEVLITDYGLEGNAIYPVVPEIRNQLNCNKIADLYLDFKPYNTESELLEKLELNSKTKDYAKKLNLNRCQIALLKAYTSKDEFINQKEFIKKIKNLRLKVNSLRPISESISTVGGVSINELNEDFSLKKYPNIYTIGEMVDWDAPTGGFLLQGCFSMGNLVSEKILEYI